MVRRKSIFTDVKSVKSRASSKGSKRKKSLVKRKRPRAMFKALVKRVINNLFWLSDTTDMELGPNAEHNFYILTHRKKKRLLSLQDKICLKAPFEERTPEKIQSIMKKLAVFKSFRNYPDSIINELLLRAKFECWNKERVIVRQGHVANFVYFVVGGTVECVHEQLHPVFENEMIRQIDMLTEGDNFGVLQILYNELHPGTVVVTSDWVEMLVLTRDSFVSILEETVKKHWDNVRWALGKFPHFDKFPESTIRKLGSVASLVTYPAKTVVPMIDVYGTELSTLLVDGTCKVMQTLQITEDLTKPVDSRYELYTEVEGKVRPKNVISVVMEICTLKRQCIFGLGDEMSENTIITDVECMVVVIPRYLLLRYNVNNIWERVIGTLHITFPSTEEIFKAFVDRKKWLFYKKKLRKEIYSKSSPPCMSIHECPVTSRAKMLRIRGKLYDKVVSSPYYPYGENDIDEIRKLINHRKAITSKNQSARSTNDQSRYENRITKLKNEFKEFKLSKFLPR